ncbi:MAG: hypothetical protein D3M94_18030 [Rhodocyclales bacterium GT-UBC]|nr:MAG: hypothetical protein D3M94_18030 [Rhodocyclales bacterium GT-UBC]
MIWWKGNGLWLGLLVALAVVSASKAIGPAGIPLGLLAAAAILLALRSVFQDASLYSVSFRARPPLLIVLAGLTCIAGR